MTWEEAGQRCFDEVPRIAKPLPLDYWKAGSDWDDRCHFLFAEEQRLKQQIDVAAIEFARTGRWPSLPAGSPSFLSVARLLAAVDTVNILLVGDDRFRWCPDPARTADPKAVLGWLCLETWNEWRWDTWLKLEVLRSFGGQGSRYGLPQLRKRDN